jgi:hypothetical protein
MSTHKRHSRPKLRHLGAVSALLTVAATSGCFWSGTKGYQPVPDDLLYAQVAALPHLSKIVDMGHSKGKFMELEAYYARVDSDGQVNPYELVDQICAIFHQGAPGASTEVRVHLRNPDGSAADLQFSSSELKTWLAQDRIARYGPQPGTGLPPGGQPLPEAKGWLPPGKR